MSRVVKADFLELSQFLGNYSIQSLLSDKEYVRIVSQCHKKYLALMVLCYELFEKYPGVDGGADTFERHQSTKNVYLQELVSDLGGALFNWCHGSYKAMRLLMRSSIENLVKGMCVIECPSIVVKSSVFEVFDIAGSLGVFSGRVQRPAFNRLKGSYSLLCADVHGASVQHMQHTKSMNYFPGFDRAKAQQAANIFCSIIQEVISVIALGSPTLIGQMHYTNADVVNLVLPAAAKKALHLIDA